MFFHAHLSASTTLEHNDDAAPRLTLGALLREGRDAMRDARTRRTARAVMQSEESETAHCA